MRDQRRLPERESYQLDPNVRFLECLVCARLAVYQCTVDNLRHYPAGSHVFLRQ